MEIEISDSPVEVAHLYKIIFTHDSLNFLGKLAKAFDHKITALYVNRSYRKYELKKTNGLPAFKNSECRQDKTWKIAPIPKRLQNRHLDLGDVSPANTDAFINALKQDVQGVQVDFDDGHCPTWKNQILGLYNIYWVVHHHTSKLKDLPIMMLRPRAWNMTEHNIMLNGKKLPGSVVDFAMLVYHNAQIMFNHNVGPYFYLSKIEGASEAHLWNEMFIWAQNELGLPYGTIKVCVLIENILASYEMEEILYELKDHCIGLNCGIWDYAASIIAKFGDRNEFVLPDRKKYVNMEQHFLKTYMKLVIQVCHNRGALATGGMAAVLLNSDPVSAINQVIISKRNEIQAGVDGFMVYDTKLVPHMNQLWNDMTPGKANQIDFVPSAKITEKDLLQLPEGKVTWDGLLHNIEVAILFIYHWMKGEGHFYNNGFVEDSATAEISRSQVWQWIRHLVQIEDRNNIIVTPALVKKQVMIYLESNSHLNYYTIQTAANIALELFFTNQFPDFITTFLNDHYALKMHYNNTPKNKL